MYLQKTWNKWSTAKDQHYNGHLYQSGFEAKYAMELDIRKKAGEIIKWERQVKIPLIVNGYHIYNYYIDFIAYYPDGTKEYIECKGLASREWVNKFKLFEALYADLPNVKILVVKQKNNWGMRKIKKIM